MKLVTYWDVAAGVVILLGFLSTLGDLQGFLVAAVGASASTTLVALVGIGLVAPAFPVLLAMSRVIWGKWLNRTAAYMLITCSVVYAGLTWFVIGVSARGNLELLGLHILAVLFGIWGMLLRVSVVKVERRRIVEKVMVGSSVLAGTWSLVTIAAVALSALSIAGTDPVCLLPSSLEGPVRSWAELRGFTFYDTGDREEPTFARHFNGLLVVGRSPGGGHQYSEWSPKDWRFETVDFEDANLSPGSGCKPVASFFSRLAIAR